MIKNTIPHAPISTHQANNWPKETQFIFFAIPISTGHMEYIATDYNIISLAPIGLSTSEEFRTKDLADLIGNIKKYDIKVIFSEKSHHQILSEKLANKAKLKLGNPLFLDGLSLPGEGASNVEDMLNYNLGQIIGSMK